MVTRLFYLGAAAASLTKEALAFTPSAPDLIKKAGSGVSIKAPGDLSLFDPNEDGKLQGTNNLLERISNGAAFAIVPPQNIVDAPPAGVSIGDAQHFLEHLDSNGELPLNFAKPQSPVTATVLGRARLISDDAPGDIEHVIMKLPAGFHYVEGERTCLFLSQPCAYTRNLCTKMHSLSQAGRANNYSMLTVGPCLNAIEKVSALKSVDEMSSLLGLGRDHYCNSRTFLFV